MEIHPFCLSEEGAPVHKPQSLVLNNVKVPPIHHRGPEGGLGSKVITDLGMHINLLLASWGVKKGKKTNWLCEGN